MFAQRFITGFAAMALCLLIVSGNSARAQIGLPGLPDNPTLDYFGLGEQSTPLGGNGDFAERVGLRGQSVQHGRLRFGWRLRHIALRLRSPDWPGRLGIPAGGLPVQQRLPGSTTADDRRLSSRSTTPSRPFPAGIAAHIVRGAGSVRSRTLQDLRTSVPFDDTGKITWPSAISNDSSTAKLRQTAEDAVRTVVRESKSTGHASVRPVVEAKNKLSAFEHQVLPGVKNRNRTDGAAVEAFFSDLDNALDALTYRY